MTQQIKEQLEEVIKKNLPEKKEKVYRSDGKTELFITSHFHFNQAISQINTSLIADEVLKVVVEKIDVLPSYWRHEFTLFPRDYTSKDELTEMKKLDDIIKLLSNLSPKENKNNE